MQIRKILSNFIWKLVFSCNQIGLRTEDYNKYLKKFELKNNFLKLLLRYLEQWLQLFESHLFRFDYAWPFSGLKDDFIEANIVENRELRDFLMRLKHALICTFTFSKESLTLNRIFMLQYLFANFVVIVVFVSH